MFNFCGICHLCLIRLCYFRLLYRLICNRGIRLLYLLLSLILLGNLICCFLRFLLCQLLLLYLPLTDCIRNRYFQQILQICIGIYRIFITGLHVCLQSNDIRSILEIRNQLTDRIVNRVLLITHIKGAVYIINIILALLVGLYIKTVKPRSCSIHIFVFQIKCHYHNKRTVICTSLGITGNVIVFFNILTVHGDIAFLHVGNWICKLQHLTGISGCIRCIIIFHQRIDLSILIGFIFLCGQCLVLIRCCFFCFHILNTYGSCTDTYYYNKTSNAYESNIPTHKGNRFLLFRLSGIHTSAQCLFL